MACNNDKQLLGCRQVTERSCDLCDCAQQAINNIWGLKCGSIRRNGERMQALAWHSEETGEELPFITTWTYWGYSTPPLRLCFMIRQIPLSPKLHLYLHSHTLTHSVDCQSSIAQPTLIMSISSPALQQHTEWSENCQMGLPGYTNRHCCGHCVMAFDNLIPV